MASWDAWGVRWRGPGAWGAAGVGRLRCAGLRPGRVTCGCEGAAVAAGRVIAQMTHRYACVDAATGKATVPDDWAAIVQAIERYDSDVEVSE